MADERVKAYAIDDDHFQSISSNNTDSMSQEQYAILTSEEEVYLINIDFFEQWDRIYQKFNE